MIVYKFGDGSGAMPPDLSPFVVKLETWLRLSGIPYEGRIGNLNAMPKKKLPVAEIDGSFFHSCSTAWVSSIVDALTRSAKLCSAASDPCTL